MDNYAAHKHPEVQAWLAANPRVHVHFTPTHASWMNLVEVWFSIIERQAIHRGTFGSVNDLNAKIRAFIDGWNDRCHPFVWTKTADQILAKPTVRRPQTRGTSVLRRRSSRYISIGIGGCLRRSWSRRTVSGPRSSFRSTAGRRSQGDDARWTPRRMSWSVSSPNQRSTWLSHEDPSK